jgi:hypothetical protein
MQLLVRLPSFTGFMLAPKHLFFAFFCSLFFCSSAFAQDPHLNVLQENIPAPDSGGRWTPFYLDFTNLTQDTVRLFLHNFDEYLGRLSSPWVTDDSTASLASSISATLWNGSVDLDTQFTIILLPHSKTPDLRLKYLFSGIPRNNIPDTLAFAIPCGLNARDTGGYIDINCKGVTACKGPWLPFDGRPLSNKENPYYFGIPNANIVFNTYNMGEPFDFHITTTKATYSISGEYSDRYILPQDSTYSQGTLNPYVILTFLGAPKSPLYDTLHCTYTSCWGTDTINAPIEAISEYKETYSITSGSGNWKAPFLGQTEGTFVVNNTKDFPISVTLFAVSGPDSINFSAVGPGVISPQSTGEIRVTFKDNNIPEDLISQDRYATLRGNVVPVGPALPFLDSAFTIGLSGTIDVYCPNYFSLIPKIEHGIHPAGIIFSTDRKSFISFFGNYDSTTEYFYLPYYDDPHFGVSVSGITLPGEVLPDTGFSFSLGLQTVTTFTGDNNHNYLTKLHWPRGNDTVTMDVLAVGLNAPPFDAVAPLPTGSSLRLWPNPAQSVLHCDIDKDAVMWIFDPLGRILRKFDLHTGRSTVDVSSLPNGLYEVSVPSQGDRVKLEIVR